MHSYYLFHKPFQVLSQFSPDGDKKTLADFFPQLQKNVYPVGRLDYDSEGLLLLTDDKTITHQLLEPSFAHPRTYWVQVEGDITPQAILLLTNGVTININGQPHHTRKAIAHIIPPPSSITDRNPPIRFRKNIPTSWLSLTLTEGKNRQVRRMTAAVGFPTLRLIRYAIGDVTLNDIAPGAYKMMGNEIKEQLLHRHQRETK